MRGQEAGRGHRLARALTALALAAFATVAGATTTPTPRSGAFLAAHPVWRVSADPTWRPYSFRGPDGRMAGLDVEFSRVLAERTGARIEWVDVPSWSEAVRRFRAGEIDLLMGTAQTAEREAEMLFTRSYAASPVAVITRVDSPFLVTLRDLAGQTVAAPEGHVTTDYLRKLSLDIRLEILPDLDAAVRAVAEGRADAMVAGLIPSATTCSRSSAPRPSSWRRTIPRPPTSSRPRGPSGRPWTARSGSPSGCCASSARTGPSGPRCTTHARRSASPWSSSTAPPGPAWPW
ncbi:MAG TPA: transporter substrate-binding domain-containing protein [Anaeromyxobacteraceae bacterium]|nr:transporter substrate-binding domain-containing protein [Anaeromyxobacteraceae bacterium]